MSGKAAPVRGPLGRFSRALVECRTQAASYGQCVSLETAGKNELKKGACAREFDALKDCFGKAMKRSTK